MMNNTVINQETKDALDRLIQYSAPAERTSIEEHLLEEIGEDEIPGDVTEMTDDELYAFAKENNITHIWMDIHVLSLI